MSTQTTNYNLVKPVGTDSFNIATMNNNSDIIDRVLQTNSNKIGVLNGLETNYKDNLVGAINENVASLSELMLKSAYKHRQIATFMQVS
jgi:hypothetical protein